MPATMKTCTPLFWSTDLGIDYSAPLLNLKDLVPVVGQKTSAFFARQDRIQIGETLQLIWCPPVSDLNGWSEQPSEIALSQLLRVKISGPAQAPAAPLHAIHHGMQRYAFDVLSCKPLLAALQAQPLDPAAWQLAKIGSAAGTCLSWDELTWCGRAEVAGLTYLVATRPCETYLEMIVEVNEQQIVGLFSVYLSPGGDDYDFGRRVLSGDELRAIKRVLQVAQPLQDCQEAYLAI
ncbi:hypothetical protein GV819_07900 [Pseudomonas sp. Fl5BN2]|nr:hypothetical protein [Pseudomonas sp. Fl5BN2]